MSPRRLGILLAALSAVIYGIYPPTVRLVYADGANAMFVILLATFIRMAVLTTASAATRRPLFQTRTDVRNGAINGFFQAATALSLNGALLYLQAPIVIIIVFTHTLMLLLYSVHRGEMKMTAHALVTTLTALLGLSFVLDIWHPQTLSWVGIGLAFICAITTMTRMYAFAHQSRQRHPLPVGAETFIFACLFILPCLLFQMPQLPHTASSYFWITLGCLASSAGTIATLYALSLLGAFQTSLIAKMEPIFTSLFAMLFIGELLKPAQYAGIAAVLVSLIAYQWIESRKVTAQTAPSVAAPPVSLS